MSPNISHIEAETSLGLHRNYFSSLKYYNEDIYDQIVELGEGNLISGYRKFLDLYLDLKSKSQELYFELKGNGKLLDFSKFLFDKGVYRSSGSYANSISSIIFSAIDESWVVYRYKLLDKINRYYDEFNQDR